VEGRLMDVVGRLFGRDVVGARVVEVAGVVSTGASSCWNGTPLTLVVSGFPRPGVGSKATQPMPSNHTSGHA
jgi:hypothetical protein